MTDYKYATLSRLSKDPEGREKVYQKMLLEDPTLVKAAYLQACNPKPLGTPPAGSPAGTPNQYSALQELVASAGQDISASRANGSFAGKAAVVVALMGAMTYFFTDKMEDVKGIEPHTERRQLDMQEKNGRWQMYNRGQDAPYNKEQDYIDQKVSDERVDSKRIERGALGLAMLAAGGLGLLAFLRKK